MRATGLRLALLAILTLTLGTAQTRADEVFFLETSTWIPTASVLTVPTSSWLATTAVVPTTFVIPTAYSTAYVIESAYVAPVATLKPTYFETRFRRRGLFGRRLVETTRAFYSPTTVYYPTARSFYPTALTYYPTIYTASALVDRAVVPTEYVATTATSCCGNVIVDSAPVVRALPVDRSAAVEASPAPRTTPRSRSSRVESEPDDESISSDVEPVRPTEPAAARPATPTRSGEVTPPVPQPPPAREKSTAPRPDSTTPAGVRPAAPAGTAGGANAGGTTAQPKARSNPAAPTAPGGDLPAVTPAEDEQLFPAPEKDAASKAPGTVRRDNLKPVLPTRTIRSEYRNVLVGIVRARGTDEPEDSVQVTVSSRTNPDVEKVALTNAFGKFAVRVPDGDWTVKVAMPSGRVYPVRQITVSSGMIFDDAGRDVPSLIITR
jgi:hypothetical protein